MCELLLRQPSHPARASKICGENVAEIHPRKSQDCRKYNHGVYSTKSGREVYARSKSPNRAKGSEPVGALHLKQTNSKFSADLTRAFAERGPSLRAIASKAGRQDAEDVVQEAFLKVVETSRKEEVKIVDNLLSRVVRCTAMDRIRRRASRPEVLNADHLNSADSGTVDPERALIARQRLTSVVATIQSMPGSPPGSVSSAPGSGTDLSANCGTAWNQSEGR